MPLARARCATCTEPLSDAPHVEIPTRCGVCGHAAPVAFGADGQPAAFETSFTPRALAAWFAAARAAMARGAPGIALGACARCRAPLVASSRQPVSLPCPHCRTPVSGAAADILVDQWPEPWAKIDGPSM